MEELLVAAEVLAGLRRQARTALPAECCGLLLGRDGRIEAGHAARNASEEPRRRFLIDPADHFAAIRRARRLGLTVMGAYHSHPHSDPIPSPTDLQEGDETLLHVIVSPAAWPEADRIRGWRFQAGNFHEVRLVPLR